MFTKNYLIANLNLTLTCPQPMELKPTVPFSAFASPLCLGGIGCRFGSFCFGRRRNLPKTAAFVGRGFFPSVSRGRWICGILGKRSVWPWPNLAAEGAVCFGWEPGGNHSSRFGRQIVEKFVGAGAVSVAPSRIPDGPSQPHYPSFLFFDLSGPGHPLYRPFRHR